MAGFIPMTSASRLPLYMACPTAAVLPHIKSAGPAMGVGNAGHEHMQMRSTHGVDAAIAALPDICRRHDLSEKDAGILTAKLRGFEWSPPSGSLAEVFLCMRKDGSVVRLPTEPGRYPKLPSDARLTATVDILWPELGGGPVGFAHDADGEPRCPDGAVLWVVDYKFGKNAEDIESNRQLEACALLAGRWTRARHVLPAVLYPGKGKGIWDAPPSPLSGKDAKEIESRIDKMERSIWSQRKRLEDGESLTPTEGPHCTYCPAEARCPAKVAMMKAIVEAPVPAGEASLTALEAERFAEILPQIQRFAKKIESALRAHVKAAGAPIQLSDGRVWGPNPHRETIIVPDIAEKIVADELGPDFVKLAVKRLVSRATLEEAVKEQLSAAGITRGVAPLMRKIMAKLGEAGALLSEETEWWQAHKPNQGKPISDGAPIEDL